MWLEELFTTEELENKTRLLYQKTRIEDTGFSLVFEEVFNMSYKLAFGDKSYSESMLILLKNYYRNEAAIKALMRDKLLKDKEVVFEYPVGRSRVDIACVGDELICYEIKTKYDNLNRLYKQLYDYSKVFEYIYVVCHKDKLNGVLTGIPEYCGIIEYGDRKNSAFKVLVRAQKSPKIESGCILNRFWKNELKHYFDTYDKSVIEDSFSKQEIIDKYKDCLSIRYARC